ncbi:site-specific DNA-methyltransferase [Emticicia oligotrophica]|uniref:site-specific DNA-methyltransferase n=1 Tax=Emticicia oligotrophica TaxID=312279 RepID=UPI00273C8A58|nr:site-specific DNA-methyltransferase [Emticicia oligotrophica]
MPTLHWIGKDKVINHHLDVPFRVLDHQYTYDNGTQKASIQNESGNKIIHGDNLEALKALLPEYESKIKCIYIDPPYNTGNEGWVYNDNVSDPKLKKWLGQVVGKEAEDLTRHDKWLCMMYPRLKLLHKLLADDGAIFISIDDNEQANLKLICDEIFGSGNCVGPIIQNKMNAKNDTINIQKNHEFIHVYRKKAIVASGTRIEPTLIKREYKEREVFEEDDEYYFINDSITTRGEGGILNARPNLGFSIYYNPETKDKLAKCDYNIELAKVSNEVTDIYNDDKDLINQGYVIIRPPRVRGKLGCWTWSIDKFNDQKKDIIITGKKGNYAVKKRTFVEKELIVNENGKFFYKALTESNSRSILDFSTNDGTNALNEIMGSSNVFDNPKNLELIEYLIKLTSSEDAVILDSFAGSGTTAHAVLNLNKVDGGNRKFIIIEMEDYANSITAERVKRVINGYGDKEGTGGSFDFYELGPALFLEDGNLNEAVGIDRIREYIWYSETQKHFTAPSNTENEAFLGIENDTAFYFYYAPDEITSLDHEFLASIKTKAEQYVIYADNCLLTKEFMAKYHIIFKKIPRDITRF